MGSNGNRMVDSALIFPGQGAQVVGMGKDLYDNFAAARTVFDRANEILKFDLKKLCLNYFRADGIPVVYTVIPGLARNNGAHVALISS